MAKSDNGFNQVHETKKKKEPIKAKAPELSQRVPVEEGPIPEIALKEPRQSKPDPKLEKTLAAIQAIPGISSKTKVEVSKVIRTQFNSGKTQVLKAIGTIRGIDQTKQKTIEKVLTSAL